MGNYKSSAYPSYRELMRTAAYSAPHWRDTNTFFTPCKWKPRHFLLSRSSLRGCSGLLDNPRLQIQVSLCFWLALKLLNLFYHAYLKV
jgi:hypothetical protein